MAEAEGTLAPAHALALRDLCEAIVLKRTLLRKAADDGWVVDGGPGGIKAHPLLTQFRGLMQRVEAGLSRFKLAPMGKELPRQDDVPADPFDEFDDAPASASTH